MTKIITLILLSFSLNSFGQLPEFKSNISSEESGKSLVKVNFSSEYEQILSYYARSHWSDGHTYFIFGYDGNGVTKVSQVSDGGTDKFELIAFNSHRISSAHAA